MVTFAVARASTLVNNDFHELFSTAQPIGRLRRFLSESARAVSRE
jgi:hypothetical protein